MTLASSGASLVRGCRRLARRPVGRRGFPAHVLAAAACAALLTGAGVAPAGATARAAVLRVHWGRAVEVPGLGALNAGGNAAVASVSCWHAGDCAAGGFYTRRLGYRQAFVVTERNGRWGKAAEVAGSAALNAGGNARVLSVSCAPSGDCAAGGYYTDRSGHTQGFVVTERGGRWGKAEEVPGLAALNASGDDAQVRSVSCAPEGCGAGGYFDGVVVCQGCGGGPYIGNSQGFVVTERGGRWGKAQKVPGLAALNTGQYAQVASVSCPSAGNCAAGGFYQTDVMDADDAYPVEAFVVSQAKGRWGTAQEVPGIEALNLGWDASVLSVSCSSAGDCGAGGYLQFASYISQSCDPPAPRVSRVPARPAQPAINCEGAFVVTENNGRWGTAQYPRYPGMSQVSSVSCPSAGNCGAGGYGEDSQENIQAEVMSQRNGRWGMPLLVPGTAGLSASDDQALIRSVSCWSAGNCGAGGYNYGEIDAPGQVFVVSERNGRWGRAEEVPGTAALNLGGNAQLTSVSCALPGNCAAGGYYTDGSGHVQAFVGG